MKLSKYLAALIIGIGLTAPMVMADDHDSKRYYDKRRKDYHQWNDDEEKSTELFALKSTFATTPSLRLSLSSGSNTGTGGTTTSRIATKKNTNRRDYFVPDRGI